MSYVGEHTWIGDLGRLMVALSFVWATFSSVAYALHLRRPQSHWLATARWSFRLHALAVVGIVAVLVQGVLMGRLLKIFPVQKLVIMGLVSSV